MRPMLPNGELCWRLETTRLTRKRFKSICLVWEPRLWACRSMLLPSWTLRSKSGPRTLNTSIRIYNWSRRLTRQPSYVCRRLKWIPNLMNLSLPSQEKCAFNSCAKWRKSKLLLLSRSKRLQPLSCCSNSSFKICCKLRRSKHSTRCTTSSVSERRRSREQ